MSEYKQVLIKWKDEPDDLFLTTVCIDGEWTEGEDDENVFFYFSTPLEFEDAKKQDNDLEFVIVEEEHRGR
jgi:hypothetical protein